MTVAPVGAEDRILLTQMGADTHSDRFLTNVGMAEAGDEAAAIGPSKLFFAVPDIKHLAIERQQLVFAQIREGLIGHIFVSTSSSEC